LFVILALGESILVTGTNFGELHRTSQTIAAFVVAFIGSAALWWIHFDRGAEAGRLGVSAYTYFHIPMVAGIIAAAGADELTIAHPTNEATVATAALILGGPTLYLAGNALFKWALWDRLPRSRLVAICALAALVSLAVVSSTLVLLVAATLVVIAVALWDMRAERIKFSST
jgi:low temperature requirement protein LtrA